MVSISCLAEVVTFLVNLLVGGNSNKSDPCHLSNNITPFLKKTISNKKFKELKMSHCFHIPGNLNS